MGATVRAFDPEGMKEARHLLAGTTFVNGPYDTAEQADALVVLTEWDQFRALDLRRLAATMNRPLLIDLRNVYRAAEVVAEGMEYVGIGKPTAGPITASPRLQVAAST
jgi:UDPglucose 6-dehydrogenase